MRQSSRPTPFHLDAPPLTHEEHYTILRDPEEPRRRSRGGSEDKPLSVSSLVPTVRLGIRHMALGRQNIRGSSSQPSDGFAS